MFIDFWYGRECRFNWLLGQGTTEQTSPYKNGQLIWIHAKTYINITMGLQ